MQPYEGGTELQLARDSLQWRRFMLAVFTAKSFESSPVKCGTCVSVRTYATTETGVQTYLKLQIGKLC